MPTEDRVPGLGRTLCVVFQHGSANSLTSIQLRPDVPVGEMTGILLGEHCGVPHAAPRRATRSVPEVATPDELGNFDADDQRFPIASREAVGPTRTATDNNPFASEADDSGGAHRPAADEEHSSNTALPIRSKPSSTQVALLIVGALSLVMVPGLVLGLATRQVQWGIALSGAIATVASFFAGLYYYHNK